MDKEKDPVAEELDKRASVLPLNLISLVLYTNILIDLIKAKIASRNLDKDQG